MRTTYSEKLWKENEKLGNTKQPEADVDKLFNEIVDYFTRVEKKTINMVHRELIDKSVIEQMVVSYLENKQVQDEVIKNIVKMFDDYVFGYHILEPLVNDEMISDIKVMRYDNIRTKKNGKRMTSDVRFKDNAELQRFVEYVAIRNKVNLSDINAIQTFTDKHTNPRFILRFNVCTPYVNSVPNAYLHIRKVSKVKRGLDYLVSAGMMDVATASYLVEKAKNARGILFTGKGASGKTTLMNELLEYIPEDRSGLAIQENEELFSDTHPDLMFQHIVTNRGEGKIQYSLQDLARNGLLLDLDYFIIGEIKGGEALYFLNAAYTGHQCWASVHGVSSTEAIDKLADYVKYESDYSKTDVIRMLKTMEVVIFLDDFKVKEISEIVGFDEVTQRLIYKRVL